MSGASLRYEAVSYHYRNAESAPALSDVSIAIEAGERVALVGANGAGKSTLLLLATGLLAASSGRVAVGATEVSRKTAREIHRQVALVFADPDDQLFCPTVLDEVAFAARQRGEPEATALSRAREVLATVDMTAFAEREPLALSLGEKKRLAIATALSTDARVLLFDEPTIGLDPRARRRILELMRTIPGTLVLATHDLDAALALDARIVLMDQGRVAADGPASVILRDRAVLERHGLELPLGSSVS